MNPIISKENLLKAQSKYQDTITEEYNTAIAAHYTAERIVNAINRVLSHKETQPQAPSTLVWLDVPHTFEDALELIPPIVKPIIEKYVPSEYNAAVTISRTNNKFQHPSNLHIVLTTI